jgi:hypothetical protein
VQATVQLLQSEDEDGSQRANDLGGQPSARMTWAVSSVVRPMPSWKAKSGRTMSTVVAAESRVNCRGVSTPPKLPCQRTAVPTNSISNR